MLGHLPPPLTLVQQQQQVDQPQLILVLLLPIQVQQPQVLLHHHPHLTSHAHITNAIFLIAYHAYMTQMIAHYVDRVTLSFL